MENTSEKNLSKTKNLFTYHNTERALFATSLSTNLAIIFTQIPDDVKNKMSIFSSTATLAFIGMSLYKIIDNSRDAKEIRKIYQEFLKNYNKLNKVFNLEDPVEISTMFNYLLYKGYLSQDKQFEFEGDYARDTRAIMGTNVIVGKGVCRHISSMLTDILQDRNIEAGTMAVCAGKENVNIKTIPEQKYTKDELMEWVHTTVHDDDAVKALTAVINTLEREGKLNIELEYRILKDMSPFARLNGNHAITYAYKDGKSYYLDPTQNRIYIPSGKILTDYQMEVTPKENAFTSAIFNKHAVSSRMHKSIKQNYPTLDPEEQKQLVANTLDICKNNTDIFEQFYRDNEDLYRETAHKVLSLKPSSIIHKE